MTVVEMVVATEAGVMLVIAIKMGVVVLLVVAVLEAERVVGVRWRW